MSRFGERFVGWMDRWTSVVNLSSRNIAIASGVVAALMMGLVTANVISRETFNEPVPGTVEIVRVMMVFLVFLPWALVQVRKGHIQVTFLHTRISPRKRFVLELVALLAMFTLAAVLTWRSGEFSWKGYLEKDVFVGPVYTPSWPARWAITAGASVFSLVVLSDIWYTVRRFVTGQFTAREEQQEEQEEQEERGEQEQARHV